MAATILGGIVSSWIVTDRVVATIKSLEEAAVETGYIRYRMLGNSILVSLVSIER
jgi:hypothetical protein